MCKFNTDWRYLKELAGETRGTIQVMSKISAFFRIWGPVMLIMTVIFAFSSIPSSEMPTFGLLDFLVKKGGHASGYALLALANLRAFRHGSDERSLRPYILAFLLAVLYS